jgi:hypothetical protein
MEIEWLTRILEWNIMEGKWEIVDRNVNNYPFLWIT